MCSIKTRKANRKECEMSVRARAKQLTPTAMEQHNCTEGKKENEKK